jgi:prepilin-type processing-associated H-X9-DG protein/prepilin-type N-terminal cleavage/methylation domain-containing protein
VLFNTRQGAGSSRQTKSAFTLIELLVVIAILAAILFPVFAQAREKARGASCLSNMKQVGTAIRMYAQDYDEQGLYNIWPNSNVNYGGVWETYMEWLNPYIKNTQVWICPSASKDKSTYVGTGCAGGVVASHYVFPAWLPYNYWNWFGTVMFAGFPTPPNSNTGTFCNNAWASCVSSERVEYPAESAVMIEGYYVTYPSNPASTNTFGKQFGSACTIGLYDADDANARNGWRHNEGGNIIFADGHVKGMHGKNFMNNNSSRTGGSYSGYPQSPFMRVGP